MRRSCAGFSLLEVLLALLLLSIGLLGFAGTLGPVARVAGEGRLRGRAALLIASRIDRLRTELGESSPGCAVPAPGVVAHGSGLGESWQVTVSGGVAEIRIVMQRPGRGGPRADTVLTRVSCP